MPYLHIHTNIHIDDESACLKQVSETVAGSLAKPESYVMIQLSPNKPMLFAGSDAPLAYVELKSLGLPADATARLSADLCAMLEECLGIVSERIYIEFSSPERHMWGWDGGTF